MGATTSHKNTKKSSYQHIVANSHLDVDKNPISINWIFVYEDISVCEVPINNVEMLHERIFLACEALRNRPRIFERVDQSIKQHVLPYIESQRGHFKYLP